MPIVFIHGVAVRREGDPGWEQVRQVTGGIGWSVVQQHLREHLAPALNPQQPQDVPISEIYWGDLGSSYALGGRALGSWQPTGKEWPAPAELNVNEVGEELEGRLRLVTPTSHWPQVIEAVWSVVRDANLREIMAVLPKERQWLFLEAAVEARLPRQALRERLEDPRLPGRLVRERRRNLRFTFSTVRRPLEDFVPLFIGDVMSYLTQRGTPTQPGILMRRVLSGLKAARLDSDPDEPLVVLTHSMGGQLMYDALTAFLPADPEAAGLRVDFWCSCGGQVGLFRELGQFIERKPLPTPALLNSPHAGYFWNVWSFSDLLSYRAEGIIQGANDTAYPFFGNVRSDHLSYLTSVNFYRTFAAKVKVHTGVPSRASGLPSVHSGYDQA